MSTPAVAAGSTAAGSAPSYAAPAASNDPPPLPSASPANMDGALAADVQAFISALQANLYDDIMKIMLDMQYNGFDPVAFRAMLIKFLTVGADGSQIRSVADAIKIVRNALMVVASRGTKVKNMSKLKPEGQTIVRGLATAGVMLNPSVGSLGSTSITLQRIGACFAMELSQIIGRRKGRIVGTIPANFPHSLCTPNALSFFPASIYNGGGSLITGWRAWRDTFSEVINSGNSAGRNLTPAQVTAQNEKFEKIVYNSTLYRADQRMIILVNVLKSEYGTLDANDKVLFKAQLDQSLRTPVTGSE